MSEEDVLMELMMQAYQRGAEWSKQGSWTEKELMKASYDYSDKMLGAAKTLGELIIAQSSIPKPSY